MLVELTRDTMLVEPTRDTHVYEDMRKRASLGHPVALIPKFLRQSLEARNIY